MQVRFAERIRREAAVATGAVGLITTGRQAEALLAAGRRVQRAWLQWGDGVLQSHGLQTRCCIVDAKCAQPAYLREACMPC